MESVELFSTGCPKCNILEKKLQVKNINYILTEGEEALIAMGFSSAPVLRVNDDFLEFSDAIKWVNTRS